MSHLLHWLVMNIFRIISWGGAFYGILTIGLILYSNAHRRAGFPHPKIENSVKATAVLLVMFGCVLLGIYIARVNLGV